MYVTQIDEKIIRGVKIRTKNADETNPETSKITGLWQRFYEDVAPRLAKNASILGVYCNYESDFTGEFDVVAGTDMLEGNGISDAVTIQAGKYLVFEGRGAMPQAVIDTWSKIWEYFSSDKAEQMDATQVLEKLKEAKLL